MRAQKAVINLLVLFMFLLCGTSMKAQFPMAAHLVLNGDFDGARAYYEGVLVKDSLNFNANQELGLLLLQYYDNKEQALFYIDRAIRNAKKKDMLSELYLGYAQALHFDSQYKGAIEQYEKTIPLLFYKPENEGMKKQVLLWIENCKYGIANPANTKSLKYRIKNEGAGINTAYPEFLPLTNVENTFLAYTARRNIVLGDKKYGPEDKSHGTMFVANNLSGKYESGMPYYKPNFKEKFLEPMEGGDAIISLSGNGEHLLFCREEQLCLTDLVNGSWGLPQKLPATINVNEKFEGSACISNDGKTIYFTLDKAGGYGGKDIYRSILNSKGEWTEGENLGEDINTEQDEDGPFLNYEENVFYFSSKGLPGYGGYDVYKTVITPKGFSKPVNQGLPVNSPADDVYFTLNRNESEGYLTSSRKGGAGDWDIYHVLCFDRPATPCAPVVNSKPNDDVYVDFAFVDSVFVNDTVKFNGANSLVKNGVMMNYFWTVNDTLVSQDSATWLQKFTREGKYNITFAAAVYAEFDDARRNYCVTKELHVFNPQVVHAFFEPLVKKDEDKITIAGTVDVGTLKIDTTKKELLAIKLEPVFFNTNKFDLRKDAKEAIRRNVSKMKVDPTIVVKITAHTDPRSSKEYNLKLSQKRAAAVVSALEKSGIKRKRILAVLAMGEEESNVKRCKGDEACLEQIYQRNRRVEFKIVGAEFIPPKPVMAKKGGKKKASKK